MRTERQTRRSWWSLFALSRTQHQNKVWVSVRQPAEVITRQDKETGAGNVGSNYRITAKSVPYNILSQPVHGLAVFLLWNYGSKCQFNKTSKTHINWSVWRHPIHTAIRRSSCLSEEKDKQVVPGKEIGDRTNVDTTNWTRGNKCKINWTEPAYMVRPCSENGRRKVTQNSIEVDAEPKESTRKTKEKLDGRYKEGHERKKPE